MGSPTILRSARVMALPQWVKFGCVGASGFIVDTLVFALLYSYLQLPIPLARVLAMIAAASFTWCGNRWFTFESHQQSKSTQWFKSLCAAAMSATPNLLTFAAVNAVLPDYNWSPYLALVAGVAIGTVCNFILSSRWVFACKALP